MKPNPWPPLIPSIDCATFATNGATPPYVFPAQTCTQIVDVNR